MNDVCIVSAKRSAVGALGKSLKNENAEVIGSSVILQTLNDLSLNTNEIDEVIMGQVLTAGIGQNPARQASIKAGIPKEIPAFTNG